MSKKGNKQNNSMFIYTALIFVVALILIILAFFGQTNLANLRKNAESEYNAEPVPTAAAVEEETSQPSTQPPDEELAIMVNRLSNITAENNALKANLTTYETLLAANGYISVGNTDKAHELLSTVDRNALTDDQKILFDQITNTINEGKEQ